MRFVSETWYWNTVTTFIVVTTTGLSLPVTSLSLRMMINPSSSSPRKENDESDIKKKTKPYRTGVMAVFTDSEHRDKVLVFKRKNRNSQKSNNATVMEWQFPQGGIKSKTQELPKEALYREVAEELGNNNFRILQRANELVRYDFPIGGTNNIISNKLYQKYQGQAHYWYLCEFDTGNGPDLDKAIDDDFDDYEWVHPNEAVERIVEWKRQAYSTGLQQLGML